MISNLPFRTLLLATFACALVRSQPLNVQLTGMHPGDTAVGYKGTQRIVYLGNLAAHSLLKSTDDGVHWLHLSISNPLAVACRPRNADVVYVGRFDRGGVGMWKSEDGGNTFFEINAGFTNPMPVKIAVSPHDQNLIYVGCYHARGLPSLFRSENGGSSWSEVRPFGSRELTITSIVFDSSDSQRLWISGQGADHNDTGDWMTMDGGNTWVQKVRGPHNP